MSKTRVPQVNTKRLGEKLAPQGGTPQKAPHVATECVKLC